MANRSGRWSPSQPSSVAASGATPGDLYVEIHVREHPIFKREGDNLHCEVPIRFAQAALQLSEYRKLEPGTLEEIIFFDHPSGENRIRRSMQWKAAHLAEVEARARAEHDTVPPGADPALPVTPPAVAR